MTAAELPVWNASRGIAQFAAWMGWRMVEIYPEMELFWVNTLYCRDENENCFSTNVSVSYSEACRLPAAHFDGMLDARRELAELSMVDTIKNFVPDPNKKPWTRDDADGYRTEAFLVKRAKAREAARAAAAEWAPAHEAKRETSR